MDVSAVHRPVAGWYSSHWSIIPVNHLAGPFIVTTSHQVNQPLAGLHDLYQRAVFLLGITGGLPAKLAGAPPATSGADPSEAMRNKAPNPITAGEAQPAGFFRAPRPLPHREDLSLLKASETKSVEIFPGDPPGPIASPAPPDSGLEFQATQGSTISENPDQITAKAEVLVEAVNRLAAALRTHDFLAPGLREYGADLVRRFADSLAPLGVSDAGGSLALDREQVAWASQENPDQVAEALWGQNSLTPELTSLAAAIVGAPGIFLVPAAQPALETYQPFQPPNPWFRVAPAHFHQVA